MRLNEVHARCVPLFFLQPSMKSPMSSSAVSQARGDLGFIANSRLQVPNRTFFGSPSTISKKGVALPTRQPVEAFEKPVQEMTGDAIIGKRTEWLESQERKLTATLNEQRSEQNNLAQQVAVSTTSLDSLQKETYRLTSENQQNAKMSRQLYEESQWVYGKASSRMMGIEVNGEANRVLELYKQRQGEIDKIVVTEPGDWALLCYPMQQVKTLKGTQALMRMKRVDPTTGQLSYVWAIVFEEYEGQSNRVIERFALTPS